MKAEKQLSPKKKSGNRIAADKREKLQAIAYLSPAAVIFLVFMVWPVVYTLYLSGFEWNMVSPNMKFIGFRNYVEIFKDKEFIKALGNTVIYVAILLVFDFAIPYVISFVLGHVVKKGVSVYRSLMFFPSLLSGAVSAIVFMWLYNPLVGPFPAICKILGVTPPNILSTRGWVIVGLSLITAWRCFGYNMVVFMAAIVEVPTEIIEAARLENASNWKIFWKIILPLTSSTALYVFIITFVFGLSYMFVPIKMLTAGGPNQASTNLIYITYQYGFQYFRVGRAAAVGVVSLVIFMLIVVIQKKLEKKVHYEN